MGMAKKSFLNSFPTLSRFLSRRSGITCWTHRIVMADQRRDFSLAGGFLSPIGEPLLPRLNFIQLQSDSRARNNRIRIEGSDTMHNTDAGRLQSMHSDGMDGGRRAGPAPCDCVPVEKLNTSTQPNNRG